MSAVSIEGAGDDTRYCMAVLTRCFFTAAVIAMVCSVSGCSGPSYFADTEDALHSSGYFHQLDHISVYYPSAISLNFPGYVVGLEEASRKRVTSSPHEIQLDKKVSSAGFTVERLLKAMRYNVPFVSQVMRYRGLPYGEGNCTLYSLYHNDGTAFARPCSDDVRNPTSLSDYRQTYLRSWDAVEILAESLAADVATNRYTHLVVAVMGLDTVQEEAIRNYKSIISSIRREAGSEFKPLFVGITWPSFFANRWFDPFWEALAYLPIADRADILGLSWLGVILNDAILPLGDSIEINVIAHSFGARATTMGLCVGPAIFRDKSAMSGRRDPGRVENFIGIAPAFSLQRFVSKDFLFYENVFYSDYCPKVNRLVFTASENDHAFYPVFWSDAVGDHDYMVKYCAVEQPVTVTCSTATADGAIDGFDAASKINYLDTSELMRYQMPGTKGAGHSDFFRPSVGRLLWRVINGADPKISGTTR